MYPACNHQFPGPLAPSDGYRPVKPLSAYSLNEYGLGEANLLIQVHAVLEQPRIPSHRVPNCSGLTRRPVEVILGPVVDSSFYVSMESLALHANGIIKDMCCRDHSKELEVGEVETVTEMEVGWLRPLRAGPSCIKDCLLLGITCRV